MKLIKALVAIGIFAVVVGATALGVGWVWLQNEIARPGPVSDLDHSVAIEKGETLSALAPKLEAAGVIRDDRVMRVAARLQGVEADIKAGNYVFPAGASVSEVLTQIVEGKVVLYRITIPEGLTTAQILRRIEADDRLEGAMPETVPEEGTLLPDTYTFSAEMTRAELIDLMAKAQDDLVAELWEKRADDVPVKSPEEAIILASVVQKEASGQDEYGTVASVFVNRLRLDMALQTDPSVHYGVNRGEPLLNSRGQRRTLLRSELDRDTPWNTYTRKGLPATPISNPGRGALEAVMDPPESEYLFFVADGKGGHLFAKDYAEHQRNVAAYRRYEAEEIARERSE